MPMSIDKCNMVGNGRHFRDWEKLARMDKRDSVDKYAVHHNWPGSDH